MFAFFRLLVEEVRDFLDFRKEEKRRKALLPTESDYLRVVTQKIFHDQSIVFQLTSNLVGKENIVYHLRSYAWCHEAEENLPQLTGKTIRLKKIVLDCEMVENGRTDVYLKGIISFR